MSSYYRYVNGKQNFSKCQILLETVIFESAISQSQVTCISARLRENYLHDCQNVHFWKRDVFHLYTHASKVYYPVTCGTSSIFSPFFSVYVLVIRL